MKAYANYLDGGLLFRVLCPEPVAEGMIGSGWYNVLNSEAFLMIEDHRDKEHADWRRYDQMQARYFHRLNGYWKNQGKSPVRRRLEKPKSATDQQHYGYKGY